MSEVTQAEFKGWARVEVMGHQSHIGFVETQAFGGTVLFRIDRPEIPEEEETLTSSDWVGSQRVGAGSVVKRSAIPAATVLVGAGSIYRIVPCDEATAMRAIRKDGNRPLLLVKAAEIPALPAPVDDLDDLDDEEVERVF
jgi:hypothetical protein